MLIIIYKYIPILFQKFIYKSKLNLLYANFLYYLQYKKNTRIIYIIICKVNITYELNFVCKQVLHTNSYVTFDTMERGDFFVCKF